MAQPVAFNDLWPDLLKAWALHIVWATLAVALPVVIAVWSLFEAHGNIRDVRPILLLLPIFLLGCVMSVVSPWRYLVRHGFRTAILTVVISVALGLFLPFGSLLGFLGAGYLLEREARGK
jgi:hypothetical protein